MNYALSQSFHTLNHWQSSGKRRTDEIYTGPFYTSDYWIAGIYTGNVLALFPWSLYVDGLNTNTVEATSGGYEYYGESHTYQNRGTPTYGGYWDWVVDGKTYHIYYGLYDEGYAWTVPQTTPLVVSGGVTFSLNQRLNYTIGTIENKHLIVPGGNSGYITITEDYTGAVIELQLHRYHRIVGVISEDTEIPTIVKFFSKKGDIEDASNYTWDDVYQLMGIKNLQECPKFKSGHSPVIFKYAGETSDWLNVESNTLEGKLYTFNVDETTRHEGEEYICYCTGARGQFNIGPNNYSRINRLNPAVVGTGGIPSYVLYGTARNELYRYGANDGSDTSGGVVVMQGSHGNLGTNDGSLVRLTTTNCLYEEDCNRIYDYRISSGFKFIERKDTE